VLQCGAVCCSGLLTYQVTSIQEFAIPNLPKACQHVCCSVLQWIAGIPSDNHSKVRHCEPLKSLPATRCRYACCSVLKRVAVCCSVSHFAVVCCSVPQLSSFPMHMCRLCIYRYEGLQVAYKHDRNTNECIYIYMYKHTASRPQYLCLLAYTYMYDIWLMRRCTSAILAQCIAVCYRVLQCIAAFCSLCLCTFAFLQCRVSLYIHTHTHTHIRVSSGDVTAKS